MRTQIVEKECERKRVLGQLERLGSHLGSALIEAARATESAKEAHTTAEQLRERLKDQESQAMLELEHLRTLKCQMAKRARDAEKRAAGADCLQAQLTLGPHPGK